MAYSTSARGAALIPNLLNGASNYDDLPSTIMPGSAALTAFHSTGCALINSKLKSMGYSAPVASSNDLYDFLASIESDFVAYRANALRSSPRTSAGERTVADQFKRAFEDGLKSLENMDLSRLNIEYTGKWYVGGTSEAEKSAVSSDTDRVAPRFYRDIGENPERGS